MGKRAIIRSVLALCLTAAGLAALFGLLAGTQSQVYAASSRPESGAASTESAPLSGPAASPPLAPLSNGSETAVITVCNSCPYTTVQAAVSDIPSGGIVKVAQGIYTDTDADSRVVYITKSL
ncbi:MAG: hypothetical protein KKC18_00440, partial [Chloroflexi bacterium]|nr:hypothetical protein [Chloroflexota bacterium]